MIKLSMKDIDEMHAEIICRSRWLEFVLGVTDRIGITRSIYSRIPTESLSPITWQEFIK